MRSCSRSLPTWGSVRWCGQTEPVIASHPRHFLSLSDWSREELEAMLARAAELKELRGRGVRIDSLAGRSILEPPFDPNTF